MYPSLRSIFLQAPNYSHSIVRINYFLFELMIDFFCPVDYTSELIIRFQFEDVVIKKQDSSILKL